MKRKMLQVLWAGIVAFSLTLSAQDDQALFDASIKEVDTGGVYLNYINTRGMAESLKKILTLIIDSSVSPNQNPAQIALAKEGSEILLNLIHLESYQAQATSAKKTNDGIFFYRSFLYTGNTGTGKPEGLAFDLLSRSNQVLSSLNMIPENARLAVGGHLNPEAAWNRFSAELQKSENPMLKQIPAMFKAQAEQKLKTSLPQLLKSIRGEYSLLVTSSGTAQKPQFYVMLTLPDQDGTLQKFLTGNPTLQKISENVYTIPRNNNMPVWIEPQLHFEKDQVRLVSNPAILSEVKTALASGGALKSAELSKYAENIPQSGVSYFYLNIDKTLIETIANKTRNDLATGILQTYPVMFGVSAIGEKGYKGQLNSNISIHDTGIVVPAITAGMLFPALTKARGKARRISCISNVKQLELALLQYAMDHKDQFPVANNFEGLNELKTKGYLIDAKVFQCPSAPKNGFSYYYLGGFKQGDSTNIPLVFDRPGNHSNYVNVGFADGHVEGIIIRNYQHPTQVIEQLHKTHKYPQELLKQLLEKCREL